MAKAVEGVSAADIVDDAKLVVTELATNAVLHARSGFTVAVQLTPEILRICVTDQSGQTPLLQSRPVSDSGGRGLRLVDALASAWGIFPGRSGKTVWAE